MSEFNEEMSVVDNEVSENEEVQAVEETTEAEATPETEKKKPELHWYVVHTYSGYENKVKVDIEKTIENRKLQDQIFEVLVPTQRAIEQRERVVTVGEKIVIETDKKTGKDKQVKKPIKEKRMIDVEVERKTFPGYVFIRMYMNEDTWFVVRNTRGVTGFVGPDSEPVPLTIEEMENLGIREILEAEFEVGDLIEVVTGVLKGTKGTIESVNINKRTVKIIVEQFARGVSVELDFSDVKKL